ncbi:MAG TPA: hypothetical protein PKA27_03685 [Fimbriimonadaceae bacterium]|nr:hypothetical protein [Fimbriimonadaceae bacterium]
MTDRIHRILLLFLSARLQLSWKVPNIELGTVMIVALIYLFSSIAIHTVLAKSAMPIGVPEMESKGEVIYLPFVDETTDEKAA